MSMSPESRFVAGLLLVIIPTIQYGGYFLLQSNTKLTAGYLDNTVRRNFFRAGHAHAGVLVLLALIAMQYVDMVAFGGGVKALVRWLFFAAPLFISAGFFFSMLGPTQTKPNGFIALIYIGAVLLASAVLTLGIGLLMA